MTMTREVIAKLFEPQSSQRLIRETQSFFLNIFSFYDFINSRCLATWIKFVFQVLHNCPIME